MYDSLIVSNCVAMCLQCPAMLSPTSPRRVRSAILRSRHRAQGVPRCGQRRAWSKETPTSRRDASRRVAWLPVASRRVASRRVASCGVLSHPVVSCPVLSCSFLSCRRQYNQAACFHDCPKIDPNPYWNQVPKSRGPQTFILWKLVVLQGLGLISWAAIWSWRALEICVFNVMCIYLYIYIYIHIYIYI